MQRRLHWFGQADRGAAGELIKDNLLPIPPHTLRRRTGGQLQTWAAITKVDLKPLFGPRLIGYAQLRNNWAKVSRELAQDRRTRGASGRDVVYMIGDAGATRHG